MTPPPANLDSADDTTGDSSATLSPTYPPLTFYPDGTSDSIRLILASRTQDDARRIQLTWEGLTGTISIQPLSAYSSEDSLSMEETEERESLWQDPTGLETESLTDNAN